MEDQSMDLIMGIGSEHHFSAGITKKLRVGTVKQLKDVGELFNDNLLRIKYVISIAAEQPEKYEEQVNKWVEILNIICIEGFTREEFEDSIPEQMGNAVHRFLFD